MLKLRAHHLLCFSRQYGQTSGWYNQELLNHAKEVMKKLNENQDIEIVRECDDICKNCPYIKDNICNKPSKYKISHWIRVMDNKVMRLIKIKPNSIHKAKDILILTKNKINDEELKKICKGCEYLEYCIKFGATNLL